MPYAIGLTLACIVGVLARRVQLDHDKALYPIMLIVVASYYVLFAVTAGSLRAVAIEITMMMGFVIAAVIGFRKNLWLIAGGLAAHGVFDWFHGSIVVNDGVPRWWPPFCLAFDVAAAVVLAVLLSNSRTANSSISLPSIGQTNVNHS